MTSFADITLPEIKLDCRFYNGYKPCHKFDGCPGCPHYQPRGEQILIIKLGAMGDVLRCKAILPALKREHPQSWIVWLTDKGSEPIARDPLVDEVRTFTPEGLLALDGRHFARLICLDKDPHAVALSAKISADRKQGFAPTAYNTISIWNDAATYALRLGLSDDLKFRRNIKTMPEIVAEVAELPYNGESFSLTLTQAARDAAADILRDLRIPPHTRLVGLNTGCGPVFATKGWTREGMADLVALIESQDDLAVLLLGGNRERETHEYLTSRFPQLVGKRLFDTGTSNSLETFFALVERCHVVLSADSLAMHVAVALKRPVVAWFGPTCAQEVDLFGRGEKIVTSMDCAPCYLKACPKDTTCMEKLQAREVFEAMERVMNSTHV